MKQQNQTHTATSNRNSSLLDTLAHIDWITVIWRLAKTLSRPVIELAHGLRTRTLPIFECLVMGTGFGLTIALRLDRWIFKKTNLGALYPYSTTGYTLYCVGAMTTPFWAWAWRETVLRNRLLKRLTDTFISSGLKSPLGTLPNFIFDRPMDEFTRKMRLSRSGLSKPQFDKARPALESSLQVYIDEIRENREAGTIDVIYAHCPMPTLTQVERIAEIGRARFVVGKTRAKPVIASLRDVPHLMVAGQTGGGKSTFLRVFIVTLYINNQDAEFTLIDLKGGLEFQTFENLERVQVIPNVERAVASLSRAKGMLETRMALLKENNCKDIDALAKLRERQSKEPNGTKIPQLNRHLFIIDEAAEMFLVGSHAKASEIQTARAILSQIARQGRSVGVHLVIATQRPDARALDPQVKANLTGVLCFQMQNDHSSIIVLGNGRATELPPIPGRAIWRCGADMTEVQVPYLGVDEADTLLKPYRAQAKNVRASTNEATDQTDGNALVDLRDPGELPTLAPPVVQS